jgi:cystathionine beta-lyase/cystathionine gamma-synthase
MDHMDHSDHKYSADQELRLETRAVHPPVTEVTGSRPLGMPIYQGHLFAFDDADALAEAFAKGPAGAFIYNRLGNPTVRALETAVTGLEGGAGALAASSGMGAVNAVLLGLLRSGDHVVAQRCLYGGTTVMLGYLADRWGVEVTYVSGHDADEVRAALRPGTRLLYLETITNPTARVADLPALIEIARQAGVVTVVDNTFASPVLCRPIAHGADIVIHSATKYLGGHSDLLGGVAVFASDEQYLPVQEFSTELGASADPFAAWLALRGLQTLALRMRRHCDNAMLLATRLAGHPLVESVSYPGLPGHPDHEIASRVLPCGQGGVLAFDLSGGREAGRAVASALRLAANAPSLGDVKTLVLHPAGTSHRQLSDEQLRAAGIGAGTIRVAVGIEHPEDLWADLEQALAKAG